MELTAYLQPSWKPLIRPAPATRPWMDNTPESFAYRCLPLNIANAHGWEVLSPVGFEATWDGGTAPEAVTLRIDPHDNKHLLPVSIFGQGVLTFHMEAIFRTPPGWNLWVGGSPNRQKDAIAPLTGIIETDWSPFTFTMNWRFTRPHHPIRFEVNEPICFLFPLQRAAIEDFKPTFEPLGADPATQARFLAWSKARDDFHAQVRREPPKTKSEGWQKNYYRGVDMDGVALIDDHQSKLRLRAFDRRAVPDLPLPPRDDATLPPAAPLSASRPEIAALKLALAKREWLLETLERQRGLSPVTSGIERRANLSGQEFLERYYAVNRPVILTGELDGWAALGLWTPDYLKAKVGSAPVQYQGDRITNDRFEIEKSRHYREAPFDGFIDAILRDGGNNAYLTAHNSELNREAMAPLMADMGYLDKFLTRDHPAPNTMMWVGPAGTVTPLHHDLTNNFIVQIVGRKRVKILPASEVGKLYNHQHVFSAISDLEDPGLEVARFPRLVGARAYDVVLLPGEILFVPLAWWHQVKALDFSVTATFTNFHWPNDGHANYPE